MLGHNVVLQFTYLLSDLGTNIKRIYPVHGGINFGHASNDKDAIFGF